MSDTVANTYVNRLRTALALQQPTGAWTNGFIYDAAARLTNVTSKAGSFGYFLGATAPASPLIRSNTLPNTSFITNAFNTTLAYDGNGNLTRSNGNHKVYTYDDENRLVEWASYAISSGSLSDGDC